MAEQEFEQAIVVNDPRRGHFALGIVNVMFDALDRAFERNVLDQPGGMLPRRLPCARKGPAMGQAAQAIGRLAAHPDRLGRRADQTGIGQHLDKAPLLLLGPAVIARRAANRHPTIVGGVIFPGRVGFAVGIAMGQRIVRGRSGR